MCCRAQVRKWAREECPACTRLEPRRPRRPQDCRASFPHACPNTCLQPGHVQLREKWERHLGCFRVLVQAAVPAERCGKFLGAVVWYGHEARLQRIASATACTISSLP